MQPAIKAALGIGLALLCSCSRRERVRHAQAATVPFRILAGSELKDVETRLSENIQQATGIQLSFTYSGTLSAAERVAAGDSFDALWVSHSKYLAINTALKGKILAQEKTMLSPVLLGLKASKAKQLGWDQAEPTWKDISDAARDGKFTFGMTNPALSNSGLTAAMGLAAALSSNPETMTEVDLKNPRLADFFRAQSLTSGSSGWLAEEYQQNQADVDGIINYESVLLSLNRSGKLSEPLTLVYPKEGIITADYPLMLLAGEKRTDYDRLVAYLRSKDFQTKISTETLRRPVNPDATVAAAIPRRVLVELAFPGQPVQIHTLLANFMSTVRTPGAERYVLDLSGSMAGERIASLKEAVKSLASDRAEEYARFQNREEVGIIPFASEVSETKVFQMGSTPEQNAETRNEIARYVGPLRANGGTAIYSSVKQALTELEHERSEDKEKRYYTVVLMTDGESNRGISAADFRRWYAEQDGALRGIRVFPILFGEADPDALKELATMSGGRVFDSRKKALATVFKEIRGYQ